jgi:cellulose synthase/poly-beta-1,6-N-acetylglucosamine synthase-like glycosyltransferase
VVDDGSRDRTAEIAEKAGAKVIRQKNSGPAGARNKGAKNAKYGILVFVDSDCIADSNFLREMAGPLNNPEISGVQGRYFTKQKEIIARITQIEIEARYEKMRKMEFIDSLGGYASAFRKADFLSVGGYDESFPKASGEDTDLSFRMHSRGMKFVFNEKAFVWHTHPYTIQKYLRIKYMRGFWRVKVYKKNPGKITDDSYTSKVMKLQVLAMGFAVALTIGAVMHHMFLIPAILCWILTVSFGLQFAAYCMKSDIAAGIVSFMLQPLATISIGFGILMGTVKGK